MARAYKIVIIVVAIVALLAAAVLVFRQPLLTALATKAVQDTFSRQSARLEDGLYAGLCGSGGPLPDVNRVESCVAVIAGSHLYIVDAGAGSARNAALMGLQTGKIEAVLLTHFHSDHIADLGEFMLQRWAMGSNREPLDVIGPAGVEKMVEGFNQAYRLDADYRILHHGAETVPPSGAGGRGRVFDLPAVPDTSAVIIEQDGLKVTAFRVNHDSDA
ncbi:MAG: MBL fold metallo-hydrolase, partial [Dehalococcoidia bacterium]